MREYDLFTERSMRILVEVEQVRYSNRLFGYYNLLTALKNDKTDILQGVASYALEQFTIDYNKIKFFKCNPQAMLFGVLTYAHKEMESLNHIRIGSEHLLLGFVDAYPEMIKYLGVKPEQLKECVCELIDP